MALASFADHGGAGRAALRLLEALLGADVRARMLVERRTSGLPQVLGPSPGERALVGRLATRGDGAIMGLQRSTNAVMHSPGVVPGAMAARLSETSSDVVNLHWVGDGALSVRQIAGIRRPMVWTMHDMWAFCGAEHYAPDGPDARWRSGYRRGNRHPGDGGLDVDRWTWQRKQRHWRPSFDVVTPSRWLARCVADSALLASCRVHVIPNALPLGTYRPLPRQEARRRLGLPQERPLVLFGAEDPGGDPRKGWDLLQRALPRIAHRHPDAHAVVFGASAPSAEPGLGLPVHWSSHVKEESVLAMHYSAADVAVVPSRQDNLPQTAVEAQACGTPVVAFDVGGLADTLDDRTTGYLAQPFDVEDLAHGISWVLEDRDRWAVLSARARERAVRLWSPYVIARQYVDVYTEAQQQEPST